MEEESKALTAFTVGPLHFYECERMPFGITNSPATFQRLMQSCLGNLHLQYCIIYLDDTIVFSKTPEEHLMRLCTVLKKLKKAELKLKPMKCKFQTGIDLFRPCHIQKTVYRLIQNRLKQFVNGQCQPMSQKCKASLGLQIIIKDSSRVMHMWPNLYTN